MKLPNRTDLLYSARFYFYRHSVIELTFDTGEAFERMICRELYSEKDVPGHKDVDFSDAKFGDRNVTFGGAQFGDGDVIFFAN
jgi:hypothetical protein